MSRIAQLRRVLSLPVTAILLLAFVLPGFGTGVAQAAYQKLPASVTSIIATDNETAIESNECPQCSAGAMGMISEQEAPPDVDFDSFFNAPEAPTEVNSGNSLYKRFVFNLPGGYVSAGTGMRNRGYGDITINGIPSGSTIEKAYLYWDILDNYQKPEFKNGKFNGTSIEGTSIGSGPDPCWTTSTMNFAYRADVTDLVTGNGIYELIDFASGRNDGCEPYFCPQDLPLTEGASLVIVYRNPASPMQTIVVYDGAQMVAWGWYTLYITGFTAPSPLGSASITLLGADGQDSWQDAAETTFVNGARIADRDWEGSDPQSGPDYWIGNLWDTNTYDVTSLVEPGDTYAVTSLVSYPGNYGYADCLVWVAAVFSVSAEPQVHEPWSFAIITDLHIGWGIPDYGNPGFTDPTPGQDYYLTERLERAVQKINERITLDKIKFVVVTGDIADTAELSEFVKARDILNQLNIPYIPIIGNHDIWPYTQKITSDPDGGLMGREGTIAVNGETSLGDGYFDKTFWQENPINRGKIEALFGQSFEMQGAPYLQNYAFSYNGKDFVAFDFASRDYKTLMSALNTTNYPKTISWLQKLLDFSQEKIFVLTHYPFIEEKVFNKNRGGFRDEDLETIKNYIQNYVYSVLNLAGHTHRNKVSTNFNSKCTAIETEATSQIPFPFTPSTGEFIRIVTIEGDDINYDTLIAVPPTAINPYITVNRGEFGVGQEVTFTAHTKNRWEIGCTFAWIFDGIDSRSGRQCKKTFDSPGYHNVFLTVTDNGDSEYLSWDLYIQGSAKTAHKVLLPVAGLVPLLNGMDMDLTQEENAQNTAEWAVITKVTSPGKPIAGLLIHFEEAKEDVDLSGIIADTDLVKRKSVIHMDSWPETIDDSKALFIPSTGIGSAYICPNATSLEEVTPLCENVTVIAFGDIENGMIMDVINYEGQEYYRVTNVKCTGGGEFGKLEKTIKSLNDYIQSLPDEAFKNNPEQRKNALENKLNEVWTKIDSQEYQEAINKLQNDIRAKADGDKNAEDWITATEAQQEVCRLVDELIAYISGL